MQLNKCDFMLFLCREPFDR